jgi:flavodoxin
MDSIVIYSSHRGNTEKVAQAIAAQVNCKAVKLTENFDAQTLPLEGCGLVFLGTGIRGGEPYMELQNYLKTAALNAERFVLFMTWAGGGASDRLAYEHVKGTLEVRGHRLDGDYFICLGQTFGFTRRGRPNGVDLALARKWAEDKVRSMHIQRS